MLGLMQHKKILFIHHSTGGNLIKEGHLRDEIRKLDQTIEFWDHNYDLFPVLTTFLAKRTHMRGLSDANGEYTGQDYTIYLSNNSPREFAEIFSRNPNDPTLKSILDYDLIAFKNCYPTTRITSTRQLEDDKKYYEVVRDSVKHYKDKQFVLVTPPPARKETTTRENAQRAKQLVNFLTSKEYVAGISNLQVFDFFTLLADSDGFLKPGYCRFWFWDSHPNKQANVVVAPIFAKHLVRAIKK